MPVKLRILLTSVLCCVLLCGGRSALFAVPPDSVAVAVVPDAVSGAVPPDSVGGGVLSDTLPALVGETFLISDSLKKVSGWRRFQNWVDRATETKAYRMTYIAVPLIVIGAAINGQRAHFGDLRNSYIPTFRHQYDDYLQYAPAALMVGLKVAGVKGRSSWGRMLTADAFTGLLVFSSVEVLKRTVAQPRPDGADNRSFPSGHTASAFMAATMLHKEYGLTRSPWYSIGGYGVATAVGLSRQMNNKHWISDVLVGAGIGILATELGYLFSDLIFKDKGLLRSERDYTSFNYDRKSSFFGLYMGFSWLNTPPAQSSDIKLSFGTGANIGVEGAWFINRYIGVGGRFTLASVPMALDNDRYFNAHPGFSDRVQRVEITPVNITEMAVGPYFNYPLSKRWQVGSKLLVGYYHMRESSVEAVLTPDAPQSQQASRRRMIPYMAAVSRTDVAPDVEETRQRMVSLGEAGSVAFGTGASLSFSVERNFGVRLFYDCNFSPAKLQMTSFDVDGRFSESSTRHFSISSTLGASVNILFWPKADKAALQ